MKDVTITIYVDFVSVDKLIHHLEIIDGLSEDILNKYTFDTDEIQFSEVSKQYSTTTINIPVYLYYKFKKRYQVLKYKKEFEIEQKILKNQITQIL